MSSYTLRQRATAAMVLVLVWMTACTSPSTTLPSSGDESFDTTAKYALHTVRVLEGRKQFKTAEDILTYMFSVQGSAELTPPNPELEPMLAQHHTGPRPANDVWIQSDARELNEFFTKHLVLSADSGKNQIIARAYREGSEDAVFEWTFQLKE